MIMRSVFNSVFALSVLSLHAQAPTLEWQNALGGEEGDVGWDVDKALDGGYVMVGETRSVTGDVSGNHGDSDAWLVKLGSNGDLEWQRCYGGSLGETFNSIKSTPDSGYIVVGGAQSTNGDLTMNLGAQDLWVLKLDPFGAIEWQRVFGGSMGELGVDVQLTSDGGYIFAGVTTSNDGDVVGYHPSFPRTDAWVVKLDASGNMEWQNALGGSDDDRAWAIRQTSDDGYIMAGDSFSDDGDATSNQGLQDAWLVKLSSTGSVQWHSCFGGSNFDQFMGVVALTDGRCIVTGTSNSSDGDISSAHGGNDVWVVQVNDAGGLMSENTFGGSDHDQAYAMTQTADNGILIAANAMSADGDVGANYGAFDYWVIKLDTTLAIDWQTHVGGSNRDVAESIVPTDDGGCAVAGFTYSNDYDVSGFQGVWDFWVVKLTGESGPANDIEEPSLENFNVQPTPAKDRLVITCTNQKLTDVVLIDALGREVYRSTIRGSATLNVSALPRGPYQIALISPEGRATQRLLLD